MDGLYVSLESRMTKKIDIPTYEIWIPGRPRSVQARRGDRYIESIRDSARAVVAEPIRGTRIDVEVWFAAPSLQRADVDNVLKPILDSLIGIVFADDAQVRSVLAVAVPTNENFGISCDGRRFERLMNEQEFLVKIYRGVMHRHTL